jgi:hypothetical protein
MQDDLTDIARRAAYGCEDNGTTIVAILAADSVDTLARLYSRGFWRNDPSEIGENLRKLDGKQQASYGALEALLEYQLWGTATDVLLNSLFQLTGQRMTRRQIVKRAISRAKERNTKIIASKLA